ncbi:MAG: NAD(P)-dependent oxidoreductase [Verrucomicrobiota bacterium]
MNISVFELEEWEKASFDALAESHSVTCVRERLTPETAEQHAEAEAVSVFIYSEVSREAIEAMPKLKLIATRSTGFDHIDMEACKERGIKVAYVPAYGENTVASHTLAMLLNIAHKISDGVDRTRKGDFSNRGLQGFDVMGKTIGIIGASGNIGRYMVRMCRGIGMKVLAQDVKEDADFAREQDFEYVDMDRLCKESDFISIHVPANPKTKDLIDESVFKKMRNGVIFLNSSRGSVVNERALLRALADGRVAAAGLDVLGQEPVIREEAELVRSVIEDEHAWGDILANETLLRMRNVYVTPHNAFNTREALQRILDVTVENLEGYIKGEDKNLAPGQ